MKKSRLILIQPSFFEIFCKIQAVNFSEEYANGK